MTFSLKNKWFMLIMNLLASIILFVISSNFSLVNYVNILFYLTFIYIILWLVLFISKGGFFNGITFGFRKFRSIFQKDRDLLKEMDNKEDLSDRVNLNFYEHMRFHALSLSFITIVLLLVYYI
ncbi:DUF3899 domain-containing protein [Lentibacillus saliphilus]|uniref:DUF3899 domain-containing protein n=1 Tax=Lentibacillus saliphilus TaxID=2737028 RepID=UPI001C2FA7C4